MHWLTDIIMLSICFDKINCIYVGKYEHECF